LIACGVMESFRYNASKSVQLSLLKRHYSVNILYIVTLVISYPFSIQCVCKLDSKAHILLELGFGIKMDMTPVDHNS
jgi:hypothetical protein